MVDDGKQGKRYSLFGLRKELEGKETSEILADFLLVSDRAELYEMLRWSIIALRFRLANDFDPEGSEVKAMDILYSLVRFIQSLKRFPSRKEQADLLSAGIGLKPFSELLRDEDSSPKGRGLRRRQREARDRNSVGIDSE
jgi:hypothetical protein